MLKINSGESEEHVSSSSDGRRQLLLMMRYLNSDTGIVVPYIVNDNNTGNFAPGHPSAVDIYGIDSYPLGFDCANPYTWPDAALQMDLTATHFNYSPSTPFSIVEFQGGSFDPWGGWGFSQCLELVGYQFERVFYTNNFASAITFFSIYMTYGGSNWGNLGHPGEDIGSNK